MRSPRPSSRQPGYRPIGRGRRRALGGAHRQVCIKVNALIDRGIVPLVESLNATPGVVTLDSCEGGGGRPAHVYFAYGADWRQLGHFVDRMAAILRDHQLLDYSLTIEWFGSNDRPRALLSVPRERVADVASTLDQLRP